MDTSPDLPALLTADQEVDLASTIEAGLLAGAVLHGELDLACDATRDELEALVRDGREAWQRMWSCNLRLAWMLAARAQRHYGGSLDDYCQEAQIGLADALMHWDHTRGVRLSTHAWRWIRWRLALAGRAECAHRGQLSRHDGVPESADERAESQLHAWVDGHLPGWLWLLPSDDRTLLIRRHGPERASIDALATDLGVSPTTVRRAERLALARARRLLESGEHLSGRWDTMAG